jgi:hypothetical protein
VQAGKKKKGGGGGGGASWKKRKEEDKKENWFHKQGIDRVSARHKTCPLISAEKKMKEGKRYLYRYL